MRKRNILLAAGACLAALALTVGTAVADPTVPTPAGPRQLAGTGSDTTERVLNGLAGDTPAFAGIKLDGTNKTVASYDASGSANITTKGANGSAPCTFTRPSGSSAGVNKLNVERTAGNGCLQYARSSTNDSASRAGQSLTYVPFAVDAVTYSTLDTSNTSRNLSITTLRSLYDCSASAGTLANFRVLLPQFNSGTRRFWLNNVLNVAGGDSATYAGNGVVGSAHPCVFDQIGGVPILENNGKLLSDPKEIIPYSTGVWLSQVAKTPGVDDDHGTTLLGNPNGNLNPTPAAPSLQLNTAAPGARDVYNVVPNRLIDPAGSSPAQTATKQVFVGGSSQVCQNSTVIRRFGFAPHPNCGSTSIQTDAGLGPALGAGE